MTGTTKPLGWRCLDCRAVWTRMDVSSPASVDSCSNCYGERIEPIMTLRELPEELRRDCKAQTNKGRPATREEGAAEQPAMGRRPQDGEVQGPGLLQQAAAATDRLKPSLGSHAEAGVTLRLRGPIPSKKNGLRPRRGGLYQDKAMRATLDGLVLQAHSQYIRCGILPAPMENPEIEVTLFVSSLRQDPDNQFTTLLDVLKKAEVIRDDNAKRFNGTKVIHPAILVDTRGEGAEIILRPQA